ncbi:ethylene-responsive transcription factor CRF2-like protein [Corchorus olitorius]|uniref:Ethylene-responsive transcription factor CRF2-like protein n=1 Tax=Corchorus olitorius TaxID=93759 RepID=A0A1R3IUF8_9ROSI|nr:ethylene-responsive transcription factor CRF2-like protein [Corchorus olitorius]
MDHCPVPSIKYTEHLNQTRLLSPPFQNHPEMKPPRVVRISVTDADATDSSSDEEEEQTTRFRSRNRVRKFVNEITIDSSCPTENDAVSRSKSSSLSKGSRKRPAAAVAELKVKTPAKSLEDKSSQKPLSSSDYNFDEESHNTNLSSPTSVLRCPSLSADEVVSQSATESREIRSEPRDVIDESCCISGENFSDFSEYSSFLPSDIFSSVPDLFDDNTSLHEDLFKDDFCNGFLSSGGDFEFGFGGFSSWQHADDHFQDIGDIFGSDPLVAI